MISNIEYKAALIHIASKMLGIDLATLVDDEMDPVVTAIKICEKYRLQRLELHLWRITGISLVLYFIILIWGL